MGPVAIIAIGRLIFKPFAVISGFAGVGGTHIGSAAVGVCDIECRCTRDWMVGIQPMYSGVNCTGEGCRTNVPVPFKVAWFSEFGSVIGQEQVSWFCTIVTSWQQCGVLRPPEGAVVCGHWEHSVQGFWGVV